MPLPNFKYESGLGHVAAYMASSKPYLSSSINVASGGNTVVTISFPNVSKFVTVRNMGPTGSVPAAMRFGFSHYGTSGSVNNNYVVLNNGESYTGDFRVTTLYLMTDGAAITNNATASVIAGMTGISISDLSQNWSGSSGVG
jgi:hypothetical protein